MISYGRQSIDDDDIAAVVDVLRGDWLTQGPAVDRFEDAVAGYTGARHAVAFSSGTAALHGATHAAGLGPGAVVATSPLTFMASANAARFVGARPALIDIDPATFNIDLTTIVGDIDAVIPVHYAGLPVDLSTMLATAPPIVIEDAAHALGAHTPDGPVGNCARSTMCCFSFHPVKPVTTGEGGVVTTNDDALADELRRFRSHGIVRRPEKGDWYYEIGELGFNYRMTDLQGAVGTVQRGKLDAFLAERDGLASIYLEELAGLPWLRLPARRDGDQHAWQSFVTRVDPATAPASRNEIMAALAGRGIATRPATHAVHMLGQYARTYVHQPGDFPGARDANDNSMAIPLHNRMSRDDCAYVVEVLKSL